MIAIPGYETLTQIYNGSRTEVYRGQRSCDQKSVVLKLLKSEYPSLSELVQFRHQYAIAKNLELPGIIQPLALENYGHRFIIVMEDFGGISLKEYAAGNPLKIDDFLTVAIALVQTLEGLYLNRIIHKDIKPENILINPTTKQVKLIDFSIASLLPRESQEIKSPNVLEGTLSYISPEQTGRMNRAIDYRTDFYSLGVTFYEWLTGQLPFQSNDLMELVHCHIARQPTPPIELVPAIPPVLSDMAIKLMAKTAEDRYQSAYGLRCDLEICWQQWQENGKISQFSLAKKDITDRFVIPEKLYGREGEVQTLLAGFDRVSAGALEMILVTGFSGIGKTAIVNEVHKPIVRQRGYFIKGKFDQFKRDIPFSSWVQAFQNLMRQLLSESAASVQKWKNLILKALGENAQVIIEVIPELELLIGKQPPVSKLDPTASENRFNRLFQQFIRAIATREHPLVIFLDDLQWADSASLKLMQLLLGDANTRYLLLIGAYRDNEVSPAHPLMLTLDEIRKTEATVNQILLAPLDQSSLNCLIADTLSCPPERALPLTELVFNKTQGNPFFSNQFLRFLYQDRLIVFDHNSGYWQCDITQLKALFISDNIVYFMGNQLQKLPKNTLSTLKLAACIGNEFSLEDLAIVCEKSQAETAADLWKALQEGLILPQSEVYKFFTEEVRTEDWGLGTRNNDPLPMTHDPLPQYKFLHDRVQQAAYFLIPESEKKSIHLKIGQLLLTNTSEREREEKIFEIVNQFNLGKELLGAKPNYPGGNRAQRDELAQLNLMAGSKAKASTAYAAAFRYLTVGLELLAADSWQTQYDLTLALHDRAAEAAFLSGNFEQMERLIEVVLQRANGLLEKVKVYDIKIQFCIAQNQQLEAIKTALPVLKLLGIDFPEKPAIADIQEKLQETTSLLAGKPPSDLIDLPLMTEPDKLAAMSLLLRIASASFQAAPELFSLIILKQIALSLKYGNACESIFAYVCYGLILCGVLGEINTGHQFGELTLILLSHLNAKNMKARTFQVVYGHIKHWKESIKETLNPLLAGYEASLETGDFEYAGYCLYIYCLHSYCIGDNLPEIQEKMANYSDAIRSFKQEIAFNYNEITRQNVLNLMGRGEQHLWRLIGEAYNADKKLPIHQQTGDRQAILLVYLNELMLAYLFAKYSEAVEKAVLAEPYLDGVTGMVVVPIFYFYDSLARLAVYADRPDIEQKQIADRVEANQKKMRFWADCAPMNYQHKFNLIEAERYRIKSCYIEAMDAYDKAIAEAQQNQYLNEEAIACELAAKFYLAWGKETIAQTYLINAYYAYARWGAKAKVEDLESRYPQLLAPIVKRDKSLKRSETLSLSATLTVASSSTDGSAVLDLASVIKASQALSGEIHLDKLLAILMQVAIENAGATSGAFILEEANELVIATQCFNNQHCNLKSTPVSNSQEIPISAIAYVWRTQETLVLNDARMQTILAADPYIIQNQPRSLLCTPIQRQGKAIGLLYLENNLTTDAFTRDRLEILKVLSSQAAISIENARLYANLEESNRTLETKVSERTRELSQTLNELKATQDELIQSEKMAALGQLIAGVAHEINTPLGAIRSSAANIATFLKPTLEKLPTLFQTISPEQEQYFLALLQRSLQKESNISSKEKRQFKKALIRQLEAEEIADADTIADTLVDMGIYKEIESFLPMLKKPNSSHLLETAYKISELQRGTQIINTATDRASKVVFALKTYARYDQSGQMTAVNLSEGIETVLTLYQNQLKQDVEVLRNYAELPPVVCYPDELNQVWTNLIHNALQAMDYRGTVTIEITQQNQQVKISITDSGKGIAPEIMPKIFEPFFTTKAAGEGSGLGLHIVKKIIDKHSGKIAVDSQPGRTTFNVFLPIQPIQETENA